MYLGAKLEGGGKQIGVVPMPPKPHTAIMENDFTDEEKKRARKIFESEHQSEWVWETSVTSEAHGFDKPRRPAPEDIRLKYLRRAREELQAEGSRAGPHDAEEQSS